MTYETSESTKDVEAVEQAHDELATEHGRDNVLVMEGSEGEIVALIGDEMGFVEPDEVQTYEYVQSHVPDHGHQIIREHRGSILQEVMKLVDGELKYQRSEVRETYNSEIVLCCTGCGEMFAHIGEATEHVQKAKNGELDTGVPPVIVTEPVFPDLDANTSRWVTCELKWDDSEEVFINEQAEIQWEIDEDAAADSTYRVKYSNGEHSCLSDAMHAALEKAGHEIAEPKVEFRPSETETPEWGGHA